MLCWLSILTFLGLTACSIGSMLQIDDVTINVFGITGETLPGALICFLICGTITFFIIKCYIKKLWNTKLIKTNT